MPRDHPRRQAQLRGGRLPVQEVLQLWCVSALLLRSPWVGEKWADEIDWATATVYEKLDGSLVTLYWCAAPRCHPHITTSRYEQEWNVSSSGVPDASGMCGRQRAASSQRLQPRFVRHAVCNAVLAHMEVAEAGAA